MKISLILPFRNRASLLPRTLRSLSEQTYRDVEVILVDNGSTDASVHVAGEWAEKERERGRRVLLLSHPDGAACAARNAGLRAAGGMFVYFFDSDDEISPHFLEEAMAAAADADIVAAQTTMVFPGGHTRNRHVYRNASVSDQILTGMLATQGMVIRRSFLVAHGGWNELLPKWNDWELGVRLLCAGPRIAWLPHAWHRIYQHPDSLTGHSLAATYREILPALKAVETLPLDRHAEKCLACRKALLAAALPRTCTARMTLLHEAVSVSRVLRVVYFYSRCHLPGAWWIYRQLSFK